MNFHTTNEWNEALWLQAEPIYHQAFPEHGRKKREIIRRMFERRLSLLHTATDKEEVAAMAISGIDPATHVMVVDYLAVRNDYRGQGWGRRFMDYIKEWAESEGGCRGIVIEVEAEPTPENHARIRFWERCGFTLTDYVHEYIWVPEPYRAMVLNLHTDNPLPADGKTLFRYITDFHKKSLQPQLSRNSVTMYVFRSCGSFTLFLGFRRPRFLYCCDLNLFQRMGGLVEETVKIRAGCIKDTAFVRRYADDGFHQFRLLRIVLDQLQIAIAKSGFRPVIASVPVSFTDAM
ncbi:GNAT family N-acetyltransferase [Paenibacillus sp. P25]|nr:GNAT family N-acetyltransferase [Paenibacillus sp. P25]